MGRRGRAAMLSNPLPCPQRAAAESWGAVCIGQLPSAWGASILPLRPAEPQIPSAACYLFIKHTIPFPFAPGPASSRFVVFSHVTVP